jgi:hypothetical protein
MLNWRRSLSSRATRKTLAKIVMLGALMCPLSYALYCFLSYFHIYRLDITENHIAFEVTETDGLGDLLQAAQQYMEDNLWITEKYRVINTRILLKCHSDICNLKHLLIEIEAYNQADFLIGREYSITSFGFDAVKNELDINTHTRGPNSALPETSFSNTIEDVINSSAKEIFDLLKATPSHPVDSSIEYTVWIGARSCSFDENHLWCVHVYDDSFAESYEVNLSVDDPVLEEVEQ